MRAAPLWLRLEEARMYRVARKKETRCRIITEDPVAWTSPKLNWQVFNFSNVAAKANGYVTDNTRLLQEMRKKTSTLYKVKREQNVRNDLKCQLRVTFMQPALKMSAKWNENETKWFKNSYETVFFQLNFVVRTLLIVTEAASGATRICEICV